MFSQLMIAVLVINVAAINNLISQPHASVYMQGVFASWHQLPEGDAVIQMFHTLD